MGTAATPRKRAHILNASAGSGKTYRLAYKYVRDVIEQPLLYRHILAVTFTNKATEEMKSRILKEIQLLASGQPSDYLAKLCGELTLDERSVRQRALEVRTRILHDYSHFTVLTIDTFFQRILRAFVQELGLELHSNLEIETASALTKGVDVLLERIASDSDLRAWLTDFAQEQVEEGQKWDISDSIRKLGGEIFKESNRPALLAVQTKQELLTIVNGIFGRVRAAEAHMQELGRRAMAIMAEAGVEPGNFYRGFASIFAQMAEGDLREPKKMARSRSTTTEGWLAKSSKNGAAAAIVGQLQPLLAELCSEYDAWIRLRNTALLLRENYRSFALLSDLLGAVQQLCREENIQLLSETKHILSAFIENNDAPFIYEKVGNRYERFMIDEFQDTSLQEWSNFLPLLRNAMSQSDQTSVLLVGDIKQSIYRWRGGDWQILHEKARAQLGPADTEVEPMEDNYRSLPVVVEFNNELIARAVRIDNDTLNNRIDEARQEGSLPAGDHARLHDMLADAYKSHRQIPRKKGTPHAGYVSVETYAEQPPLTERIKEVLDRGFKPKDILILVRKKDEGVKVAAELLAFKHTNTDARYRFDVMTQEALIIGSSPLASFLAASFYLAQNPDDALHRAWYNHYLGDRAFNAPLPEDERLFFRQLRLLPPEEAFEQIVIRFGLQHDRSQLAYLQAFHEQVIGFCADRVADIPLFLEWWEEQGRSKSLSVGEGELTIEVNTIHKAKGLERAVVIIPYTQWVLAPQSDNIVWSQPEGDAGAVGSFPVRFKNMMAQSAFAPAYYAEMVYAHIDAVNLLYVALTRAVESLHIFVPAAPTKNTDNAALLMLKTMAEKDADGKDIVTRLGGRCSQNDGEVSRWEFGTFEGPAGVRKEPPAAERIWLEDYPVAVPELRLHLPSQRYFEEMEQEELSARNFGILMHRAFEQAETEAEIRRAVEAMRIDGVLSEAEAAEMQLRVDRALADPRVGSWYDGRWQRIRNEEEIIDPASRTTRRPDRVMTDGTRAVVVDYKFGRKETERYKRQIREYMELLRRIGYTQVEGYLWFVALGEVVEVESR